jgi:excisionase family DNA binding protein
MVSRTAPARQNSTGLGLVRSPVLLTVREAAELLRVRPVTVYRLCARGVLPHVRVSNAIRIRAEDLEQLLRGGEA